MESTGGTSARAVRLRVGGRVQGVGYRYFALGVAESHGVRGFVRNLEDGAVEVLAEGASDAVQSFLTSLRPGPRGSRVDEFEVLDVEPTGAFRGFGVRY